MFRRLTLAELGAWQGQRPNALVLDARDADSHAKSGWPGSVFLGRHNQDQLLLRTDRRQPVLIYCYHGNASQTWAQMFADFGFTDVCDLVGGHAAWVTGTATANPSGKTPTPELAAWLAREGFVGPDGRGAHGNTPLMVAAWRAAAPIVEALLAHGVLLDAVNSDGNNALWLACVNGNLQGIERLAKAGVPINHANTTGATSLMYAASSGKTDVLRTLLLLNADQSLRTQDDFSALDMAANIDCLQLLRKH
ncbi:ankyrin repeat domain-containing protein [Polaromonas sp.]|uniref:ankyrin repeat domain-containing protein n=1 Tax=Polaromonas sp. TaxID=1869339 RepID=UPI003BB5FE76